MKKAVLFLLLSVMLVLCGCASVSLTFRLNDDNTVRTDYVLSVDEPDGDENVSAYLHQIRAYWESLGLDVTVDDATRTLSGAAEYTLDSAAQAAAEFARQATADDAVFYDVAFEHMPSFDTDTYSFSAHVSLVDIIRQSNAQNIPANLVSDLLENASKGSYTVSLSLPGSVVSTNADSVEGDLCTWVVPFGEERQLYLQTQRTNTENIALYSSLQQDAANRQLLLTVCIAVGAVSLFTVIAALLVRRVRLKRLAKVRVKQFR